MYEQTKVILVGNAKGEREVGKEIDSYDIIVRFNRFQTDGFESIVGSKLTHWILSSIWEERGFNKRREEMSQKYPDFREIFMLSSVKMNPQSKQAMLGYKDFNETHSLFPLGKMSTGIIAIFYFLEFYSHITITNFDFGKTNHYFGYKDWEKYRPDKKKVVYPNKNHEWDKEAKIVSLLRDQGKVGVL